MSGGSDTLSPTNTELGSAGLGLRKDIEEKRKCQFKLKKLKKQGRIHGNPVAHGWAGAVMQKPRAIQKCYGRTDRLMDGPTDTVRQGVESRVCG